jgi:copper(I)-binding protein
LAEQHLFACHWIGYLMSRLSARAGTALAATLIVLSLGACASGTPAPSVSVTPAAVLSIKDPWVKTADSGMSAAFGTLVNNSGKDITVTAAKSAVSPMMELHEVAMADGKMVMRPKAGGFVVKAGGTHELEPGGDHLMMMDLTTPVKAGDQVAVILTLSDGSTVEITAVGKPFAGANESYAPSAPAQH